MKPFMTRSFSTGECERVDSSAGRARAGRLSRGRRSAEGEGEFARNQHSNRFSDPCARLEAPLLGGLDGFLIETERRVERLDDVYAADRAVCTHDTLEQDRTLDLRAHSVGGVLRLHLADDAWVDDAAPGAIHAAAGASA